MKTRSIIPVLFLALGSSRDTVRLAMALLLNVIAILLFSVGSLGASTDTIVVPNSLATVSGNANGGFPFNCAFFGGPPSMRYQQVYLGSEVSSGTITQIAFRRSSIGFFDFPFPPTTISNVTITLSSTAAGPDHLNPVFASNIGPDVTTVFRGDLTLSSSATGSAPLPFDIMIPLKRPFLFDGSSGANLLMDVTIPICTVTRQFDTEVAEGDSISRAFARDAQRPTADRVDSSGLITQFTFGTPATPSTPIPTLSQWMSVFMALLLASLGVRQMSRRAQGSGG